MPWILLAMAIAFAYGLVGGLVLAPADYQQGDSFRIIYVHVPAAFLSLMAYVGMAVAAALHLIWRIKVADLAAAASAPLGASFTLLALITGGLWGKPMWGTWWIWDARLTSELILLFLYVGYMALRSAIPNRDQAAKASAVVALCGVINIPIIHYSVEWWHTLHQGATISRFARPAIADEMLYPLLAMLLAFFLFYIGVLLIKIRGEILRRERGAGWMKMLGKAKCKP